MKIFVIALFWSFFANATIQTGELSNWLESGEPVKLDDFISEFSDIQIWWSIRNDEQAYLYAYNAEWGTRIALTQFNDICQLDNKFKYRFSTGVKDWSVQVYPGAVVVFKNVFTGYYAAVKVEDIRGGSAHNSFVDLKWYFDDSKTGDFSSYCH